MSTSDFLCSDISGGGVYVSVYFNIVSPHARYIHQLKKEILPLTQHVGIGKQATIGIMY
jgi:hypothetical protein